MRRVLGILLVSACGFHVSGRAEPEDAPAATPDMRVADADPDGAIDAPSVDAPIDAMPIDASLCGIVPGSSITVSPTQDWEISSNGTTWQDVALPSTNWPCDNCTRYFRTTVCGEPQSVQFKFASDNRARMRVNGTVAYDEYWIAGYCSDQPCCTKCCDSTTNCNNSLSGTKTLNAQGLALFQNQMTNVITWEVSEEVGGSGFHAQMTIGY